MSVKFPHRGSGRHETPPPARPGVPNGFAGPRLPRDTQEAVPGRACCCPAKPQVKVVMPATDSRPAPVDLWLCGHHWRASRTALTSLGAAVFDVSAPGHTGSGQREGAPV